MSGTVLIIVFWYTLMVIEAWITPKQLDKKCPKEDKGESDIDSLWDSKLLALCGITQPTEREKKQLIEGVQVVEIEEVTLEDTPLIWDIVSKEGKRTTNLITLELTNE